jgi:tetratricopeptide (TPR) repeat protein
MGICLFLGLVVWFVFGQTLHYGFVNFDDSAYVYENAVVTQGLNLRGIVWAFTHSHVGDWTPLTFISHMLACQFYGLNPGGHHLINVILHAATVILLFLVLRKLTGQLWPSAFVAAVFAIHPLRVESVAWVAERKDVLSGLFFMLTLWAYGKYVSGVRCQVSGSGHSFLSLVTRHLSRYYWLALLFFACGLMSKPMLVTLPFVLLLLDYWPLRRIELQASCFGGAKRRQRSFVRQPREAETIQPSAFSLQPLLLRRLLWEKLPFLLLSAAVSVIAVRAVQRSGSIASGDSCPIGVRLGNALISYFRYFRKMFWPDDLAVVYPYPGTLSQWQVLGAGVFLAAVSVLVVWWTRQRPFLLVGWLWYLGMLVPVIGIVQVGSQAHADRYTYLPQVGLYVMVAWGAVTFCGSGRWVRMVLRPGAVAILASLLLVAHVQTTHWRDSGTLWTHTLACTSGNDVAHYNLGNVFYKQGRLDEANHHFKQALQFNPNDIDAHINLGCVLMAMGKNDEAMGYLKRALQIRPQDAGVHLNLGVAFRRQGRLAEAVAACEESLRLNPNQWEAHENLGIVFEQQGKLTAASTHFRLAIEHGADPAELQKKREIVAVEAKVQAMIAHLREAINLQPQEPKAYNNLAWMLATHPDAQFRDGKQAVEYAARAVELTRTNDASKLDTLAAAYAEAGRYGEAVEAAKKAVALVRATNAEPLAREIESRLRLYECKQPFREAARQEPRPITQH